jgi:predicted nucleotidyltransferase
MNEKSLAYDVFRSMAAGLRMNPLKHVKEALSKAISKSGTMVAMAYIFGSVADGTSGPDSDIDVLVIVDDKAKDKDALLKILETHAGLPILEKTGNEVSFHIYTMHDVEKNRPAWLRDAVRRGDKVY